MWPVAPLTPDQLAEFKDSARDIGGAWYVVQGPGCGIAGAQGPSGCSIWQFTHAGRRPCAPVRQAGQQAFSQCGHCEDCWPARMHFIQYLFEVASVHWGVGPCSNRREIGTHHGPRY